jgi:16S rRNA (guanine527-N7)-methyltransferase
MEKFCKDIQDLLGVKLSDSQVNAFTCYEEQLMEYNAQFNLTAIRDLEGIRLKHFIDSLTCLLAIREKTVPPKSLIDIGTGAGFPGIPLKIIYPTMKLTLVESVGKKARFCEHITQQLKMENVVILQSRAEDLGQDSAHREQYDWAVARAVAQLPTLVEYLLPLIRVGGAMIAQKGETGPAEAQTAQNAINLLGGQLHKLIPVQISGVAEDRFLVVVNKIAATPKHLPRRVGIPSKTPL